MSYNPRLLADVRNTRDLLMQQGPLKVNYLCHMLHEVEISQKIECILSNEIVDWSSWNIYGIYSLVPMSFKISDCGFRLLTDETKTAGYEKRLKVLNMLEEMYSN